MNSRDKRIGYTLIEVLVFMGVGGVVFFLGIQLVHMSLRISSESKDQGELDRVLASVARDFRRDMRSVVEADLISPTSLKIRYEDGNEAEWRVEENQLKRFGGLKRPYWQEYKLGEKFQAKFSIEPSSEILRLQIDRNSDVIESSMQIERLIECRITVRSDLRLTQHLTAAESEEKLP